MSAYKDAVSLFQRHGKDNADARLKDWAATTTPALKRHLKMAQNLNKQNPDMVRWLKAFD